MLGIISAVAAIAVTALITAWIRWGLEWRDIWSISLYRGANPLQLQVDPKVGDRPVLQASDVTDVRARFVADPFLLHRDRTWYLFFEVYDETVHRGIIAVATSTDRIHWSYDRVVLREPFHLSYPYVFEVDGAVFMIPESGAAGSVRLYKAVQFPYVWEHQRDLLNGEFYDSSVIELEQRWWLFTMDATESLRLFSADALSGSWTEHPSSPIVPRSRQTARPGGRLTVYNDTLYRFAQNGLPTYGTSIRVFQILKLTPNSYSEQEITDRTAPLRGSGIGWNATGMHHVDAQELVSGGWMASVDGNRQRRVWNWRRGACELQRRIIGRIRH